jgi:hypothetical protein
VICGARAAEKVNVARRKKPTHDKNWHSGSELGALEKNYWLGF